MNNQINVYPDCSPQISRITLLKYRQGRRDRGLVGEYTSRPREQKYVHRTCGGSVEQNEMKLLFLCVGGR